MAMMIQLHSSLCLWPMRATIVSKEGSVELDSCVITDHLCDGLRSAKFISLIGSVRLRDIGIRVRRKTRAVLHQEAVSEGPRRRKALRFHNLFRTVHTLKLLAGGTKKIIIPPRIRHSVPFT